MKLVVIDIETTGFVGSRNEILEVALITYDTDKKSYVTYEEYVNVKSIPKVISKLTGITTNIIKASGGGKHEKDVLNEIINITSRADILIGHNIKIFDIPFINERLKHHKIQSRLSADDAYDTMLQQRAINANKVTRNYKRTQEAAKKYKSGSVNLAAVCEKYKLKQKRKHRALDDALCTLKIFLKQVKHKK